MILPIILYMIVSILSSLMLMDKFIEIVDGLYFKKGIKIKHLVIGILFLPGTLLVATVYLILYLYDLFSKSNVFKKLRDLLNKQVF